MIGLHRTVASHASSFSPSARGDSVCTSVRVRRELAAFVVGVGRRPGFRLGYLTFVHRVRGLKGPSTSSFFAFGTAVHGLKWKTGSSRSVESLQISRQSLDARASSRDRRSGHRIPVGKARRAGSRPPTLGRARRFSRYAGTGHRPSDFSSDVRPALLGLVAPLSEEAQPERTAGRDRRPATEARR